MTRYIEISDANDYFAERLHTESWDDASNTDKNKALSMATRAIERLNFLGVKAEDDQELQFPRGYDTVIPQDIKDACCELALTFLNGVDADMEHENVLIQGNSFSSVSNTYNRQIAQEHVVAGIPSPTAWKMLIPYLRDAKELSVSRAN